jgi:DNA-directed RNA polymerase I, II, and III subunit RPABC2
MSDLEMSDNEKNDIEVSDDEASISKPIIKTTKSDSNDKEYDSDGELVVDVDDVVDDAVEDVDTEIEDLDADDDDDDDGNESDDDISVDPESEFIDQSENKPVKKSLKSKKIEKIPETQIEIPTMFEKNDSDYESDEDEEEDTDYLQKFDKEIRDNYILQFHPEAEVNNYSEIYALASVQRNKDNIIVDNLHKTVPILTKFEKTKILGLRAKQINNGAKPMITLKHPVIDGYLIALKELEEKKIPVIIRRPLPNNTSEYWHLKDLEVI